MKLVARSVLPALLLSILAVGCSAAVEEGAPEASGVDEAAGTEQAPLIAGKYLASSISAAPLTPITLSTSNAIDWVAMYTNPATGPLLQRKANTTPQILEPTFPRLGSNGGALSFSWTGGTPLATATAESQSHTIVDGTETLQFTVPAEAQGRQVVFYGGTWGNARFTASLDGMQDIRVASGTAREPYYFAYAVDFDTATSGQKLTVKIAYEGGSSGGVSVYAAQLFKINRPVNISLDATDSTTGRYVPVPYAGDSITLRAGVEGNDVRGVEFFRNGTKIGEDLTYPYELPVTLPVGRSNYTAKATNNSNQVSPASNTVSRNAWFLAGNFKTETIPDASAAGLQGPLSTTTVGGKSVKQAIALVNIHHTWDADLSFSVRSPTGVVVSLASAVGGSGDDFNQTVFRDDAATSISAGSPSFRGDYRPLQPLSALINQPLAGTWRIDIADTAAADVGTVDMRMLLLRVDD
jgi:subtilisin-like proprotein convertase family protein